MNNTINLKVHKANSSPISKYRFGISVKDSAKYFKTRNFPVILVFKEKILYSKTTCGQWKYNPIDQSLKFTKGFDLYSPEINLLIKEQKLTLLTEIPCSIEIRENYIFINIKTDAIPQVQLTVKN